MTPAEMEALTARTKSQVVTLEHAKTIEALYKKKELDASIARVRIWVVKRSLSLSLSLSLSRHLSLTESSVSIRPSQAEKSLEEGLSNDGFNKEAFRKREFAKIQEALGTAKKHKLFKPEEEQEYDKRFSDLKNKLDPMDEKDRKKIEAALQEAQAALSALQELEEASATNKAETTATQSKALVEAVSALKAANENAKSASKGREDVLSGEQVICCPSPLPLPTAPSLCPFSLPLLFISSPSPRHLLAGDPGYPR